MVLGRYCAMNVSHEARFAAEITTDAAEQKLPADAYTHKPFIWGGGIECSFVPHLNVDQFEWTQHNRFWRDDFRRAREQLGLQALRYSLPWHQIESQRGIFDWSKADERIQYAKELGLDLYLDVMHFGTPLWLKQAAGDP